MGKPLNLVEWYLSINELPQSTRKTEMIDRLFEGLAGTKFAKQVDHGPGANLLDEMAGLAFLDYGVLRKGQKEEIKERLYGWWIAGADPETMPVLGPIDELIRLSQKHEYDLIRMIGKRMLRFIGEEKTIWIYNILDAAGQAKPGPIDARYKGSPTRRAITKAMQPLRNNNQK